MNTCENKSKVLFPRSFVIATIVSLGELTYKHWQTDIRHWQINLIHWGNVCWGTGTLAKWPGLVSKGRVISCNWKLWLQTIFCFFLALINYTGETSWKSLLHFFVISSLGKEINSSFLKTNIPAATKQINYGQCNLSVITACILISLTIYYQIFLH